MEITGFEKKCLEGHIAPDGASYKIYILQIVIIVGADTNSQSAGWLMLPVLKLFSAIDNFAKLQAFGVNRTCCITLITNFYINGSTISKNVFRGEKQVKRQKKKKKKKN